MKAVLQDWEKLNPEYRMLYESRNPASKSHRICSSAKPPKFQRNPLVPCPNTQKPSPSLSANDMIQEKAFTVLRKLVAGMGNGSPVSSSPSPRFELPSWENHNLGSPTTPSVALPQYPSPVLPPSPDMPSTPGILPDRVRHRCLTAELEGEWLDCEGKGPPAAPPTQRHHYYVPLFSDRFPHDAHVSIPFHFVQ
jgi:hypothetical protein